VKEKLRSMWIAGDFGRIAIFQAAQAERSVGRLGLSRRARWRACAVPVGSSLWRRRRSGASKRNGWAPFASRIETTVRRVEFDNPFSAREVVQHFREHFGPTKTAFARLDATGQEALAADSEVLWRADVAATRA
jgi:hypothetical protein